MQDNKLGTLSSDDIDFMYEQYEQKYKDIEVVEQEGLVVFLDALGWKKYARDNQIESFMQLVIGLESRILDEMLRVTNDRTIFNVDVVTLSDTIVILINGSFPYLFLNIFKELARLVRKALDYSFVFRGAISWGKYKCNKQKNIFVGDPIYEAAQYCESTNWAGIVVTDSLSKELLKDNSYEKLEEINLIKYEDIPYKEEFLTKHKKCEHSLVLNPNLIGNRRQGAYFIDEKLQSKYQKHFSNEAGEIISKLRDKYDNTIKFLDYVCSSISLHK